MSQAEESEGSSGSSTRSSTESPEESPAESSTGSDKINISDIQSALEASNKNSIPTDPNEEFLFFMEKLGEGELLSKEPDKTVEAALCFYEATKVYPKPAELMPIYEKAMDKSVYQSFLKMISLQSPHTDLDWVQDLTC